MDGIHEVIPQTIVEVKFCRELPRILTEQIEAVHKHLASLIAENDGGRGDTTCKEIGQEKNIAVVGIARSIPGGRPAHILAGERCACLAAAGWRVPGSLRAIKSEGAARAGLVEVIDLRFPK